MNHHITQNEIHAREAKDARLYRDRARGALGIIEGRLRPGYDAPRWQREALTHRRDPHYVGVIRRVVEREGARR